MNQPPGKTLAQAKDILVYYFRLCMEATGQRWDDDNRREIESIVDLIIAAARDPETETIPQ